MDKEKVLVIGAARSGVAATELLLNHDYDVVLTDNRDPEKIIKEFPMVKEELSLLRQNLPGNLELEFGTQIEADRLDEFDFIVPSPGVPDTIPILARADEQGVPVLSEPELAYELSDTPFIAITGTNGKTTTTTLTGEIFSNAGRESYVVGNIGDPICSYVDLASPDGTFVTEIGSFQLFRTHEFKPKGAVILNITPDHLDRHKTMQNYIDAKAKIFKNQDEGDFYIINLDDPITRELGKNVKAQKKYISLHEDVEDGAVLKGDTLYIKDQGKPIELATTDEMGIKGPHNVQNALAASALAYFSDIPVEDIRDTLINFKGVEHRQEFVEEIDGIRYINDSKGTNTDAAITALNAMQTPVVLIAGGYDKKEDYTNLAKKIKEKVRSVVLLGTTADNIEKSLLENGVDNISKAGSFKEAVEIAREKAQPGDTVLLSPACASWDMFDNYEQRGDLFKEIVRSFKA